MSHHEGGAEQAVEDFHQQVASIASQLISEYRETINKELSGQGKFPDTVEGGKEDSTEKNAQEERSGGHPYSLSID